jgi:hypothetical protein
MSVYKYKYINVEKEQRKSTLKTCMFQLCPSHTGNKGDVPVQMYLMQTHPWLQAPLVFSVYCVSSSSSTSTVPLICSQRRDTRLHPPRLFTWAWKVHTTSKTQTPAPLILSFNIKTLWSWFKYNRIFIFKISPRIKIPCQ